MSDLRVIDFPPNLALPAPPITTRWLNAAEAAEYLGVSGNKLREMRGAWETAHGSRIEMRIGERGVRFAAGDLERLLQWWSDRCDRRTA